MKFQSTKLIKGFSTCFRQWKAVDTHCKFLHGYAISFKLTFEGSLDFRNWVMDFGFLKRSETKISWHKSSLDPERVSDFSVDEFFKFMFDHTTVISEDDPALEKFIELDKMGVIQLRIIPKVGCEKFAQFVSEILNRFLEEETDGRVKCVKVECFEHAENSAIYLQE